MPRPTAAVTVVASLPTFSGPLLARRYPRAMRSCWATAAAAVVLVIGGCGRSSGSVQLGSSSPSTTTSFQGETSTSETSSTTTTTAPTTTTVSPTTTSPATTTTPRPAIRPGEVPVTIVNDFTASMDVTLNDVFHRVPAHTRVGPFGVRPGAHDGNDVMEYFRSDQPSCGGGGANGDFQKGASSYEFHIEVSPVSGCNGDQPTAYVDPGHQGI